MWADRTFDVLNPFMLFRALENFSLWIWWLSTLLHFWDPSTKRAIWPSTCTLLLALPLLLSILISVLFLLLPHHTTAPPYDVCSCISAMSFLPLCLWSIPLIMLLLYVTLLCFVPMFSLWLVLIPIVTLCLTLHYSFNTMSLLYRIFSMLMCSVIYK